MWLTLVRTTVILFDMIRKAAVSGQFYPDSQKEITSLIEQLMPAASNRKCAAKGIIVPHAGYTYSGKTAIATIASIAAPKNIIMLGPNHTGLGKNFALADSDSWQTPLGEVSINKAIAEKILNCGSLIEKDSLAHRHEHSLEVELPILQHFFKDFSIIPICCSLASLSIYKQVANQISQALKNNNQDTLILASTDLTHFEPDEAARQKDRQLIDAMLALDPEKLIWEVTQNKISMCGLAPVAIALLALKDRARKAELILYQTSADSTGDFSSVVGYAGIILK